MKTKTKRPTPASSYQKAVGYAKQLKRKDYGPVTIVRAVAIKHGALKRREVLHIAAALGINQGTASRQYQEVRSGKVTELEGL